MFVQTWKMRDIRRSLLTSAASSKRLVVALDEVVARSASVGDLFVVGIQEEYDRVSLKLNPSLLSSKRTDTYGTAESAIIAVVDHTVRAGRATV